MAKAQPFDVEEAIRASTEYAKVIMSKFDASHDFKHICRVLNLARRIKAEESKLESCPVYDDNVITLASLLHDVADHKYTQPGEDPNTAVRHFMLSLGAEHEFADKIQGIVLGVSYSAETKNPAKVMESIKKWPELAIVQDADRLDAIGAVGIGRCLTYNATHAQAGEGSMDEAIKHFEEKLVKVEARMKTQTGRRLARERTERIELFRTWWAEETAIVKGYVT